MKNTTLVSLALLTTATLLMLAAPASAVDETVGIPKTDCGIRVQAAEPGTAAYASTGCGTFVCHAGMAEERDPFVCYG